VVRSNFGSGPVVKAFYRFTPLLTTPEKAGDLLVWLATAPADRLRQGGYYEGRTRKEPARPAADPALAARLWEARAKAVNLP
jgi:hypothetical protein